MIIKSFKKNLKGIILIIISAAFVAFGQMFWKMFHTQGLKMLVIGFALYGIGALIMLVSYKFGSLSVIQPMMSITYIFAIFIAMFFLHEAMTSTKLIGIGLIFVGAILIGGGDD